MFNDNNPSSAHHLQLECCWGLPGKNGFSRQSIAWVGTFQDARAKHLWDRAAKHNSRGKYFCESIKNYKKIQQHQRTSPFWAAKGTDTSPFDWQLQSPIRHFIRRCGAYQCSAWQIIIHSQLLGALAGLKKLCTPHLCTHCLQKLLYCVSCSNHRGTVRGVGSLHTHTRCHLPGSRYETSQ